MKNLSEKEILHRASESHLGQGIRRLTFRRLGCRQDFYRNGELVFKKGTDYHVWVVRYVDYVLEITKDFVALPTVSDENSNLWYAVPLGVFEDYQTAPKTTFWTAENGVSYRLIADVCDRMQYLIPAARLDKSCVLKNVLSRLKGQTLSLQAVPRLLWAEKPAVIWFIRQRLAKETKYFYLDVISDELHPWGDIPYTVLAPISSNAKAVEAGEISIFYRHKTLEYRF